MFSFQAFVHVSSAYVNATLSEVYEKLYPAPANVEEVLTLVEKADESTLKEEFKKIIKDHPNPYTFTKHLAEHEVAKSKLPATIVRPSMSTIFSNM